MLLETVSTDGKLVRAVNSTATSFATPVALAARPVLRGASASELSFVSLRDGSGGRVQNAFLMFPIGVGADDTTFSFRVYGVKRVVSEPGTELYFRFILAEFACTLSASVGLAGRIPDETNRFADTITLVFGNDDVTVEIISPANNTPAHVMMDAKGVADVEFAFDMTGATSGNVIICGL